MCKKILLLLCCWLLVLGIYGQDIITRTDGVEIKAQGLEIKPGQINFRLYQQPDSLVYQISVQDVQRVKMADGTVRNFAAPTNGKKDATEFKYETDLGQNVLWFYPVELPSSNLTLAYERIMAGGKIGFRIPVALGFGSDLQYNSPDDFRRSNRFGTGLEINYYPFGQGRLVYYLGSSFHFRSYRTFFYGNSSQQPGLQKAYAEMYALSVKNGIFYQISKSFVISLDAGLGFRFFHIPLPENYYRPNNRAFVPGNLYVGFRF